MWMCINHLTHSWYEPVVILSVSFRGTCGACGPSPSTPSLAAPASWRYDAAPTSTSSHRPSVPTHRRARERGRKRWTALVFSSSLIPVVILQPVDEQLHTDFTARWIHALLSSPFILSFFLYLFSFSAPFHLYNTTFLSLASIPSSHSFLFHRTQPHFTGSLVIWTWTGAPLSSKCVSICTVWHHYGFTDCDFFIISCSKRTVDEERRFFHSLGWRWPYKGPAHNRGQHRFPLSFPRSLFLFPFLIKPNPHPSLPPSLPLARFPDSPSFAETCILFRKILFLAYTEMMRYKLWGRTALCIYVYTCIRGYHVEVQVCARSCVRANDNAFKQEPVFILLLLDLKMRFFSLINCSA